jgi:hypothetical protein
MKNSDKIKAMKMECDRLEALVRQEREDITLQMKASAIVIDSFQRQLLDARRDLVGMIKVRTI